MLPRGLEPLTLTGRAPKARAYTNSATEASHRSATFFTNKQTTLRHILYHYANYITTLIINKKTEKSKQIKSVPLYIGTLHLSLKLLFYPKSGADGVYYLTTKCQRNCYRSYYARNERPFGCFQFLRFANCRKIQNTRYNPTYNNYRKPDGLGC